MKDARVTLRTAGRVSFVVLGFGLMGCTNPSLPPLPPTMAGLPDDVDPNPDTFRRNLGAITRESVKIRPRPARCFGGGCSVDIEITVLTKPVPDPDKPPASGYPIAIFRNLDPDDKEAKYGLDPATEADYYLWIDKVPNTNPAKTRYVLLRVPPPGAGGRVQGKGAKQITECHRDTTSVQNRKPDVDFAEFQHSPRTRCRPEISTRQTVSYAGAFSFSWIGVVASRVGEVLGVRAAAAAQIWTSCDPGCCT